MYNIDYSVQTYEGKPVKMSNNKSLFKYTLQKSIKNIRQQQNRSYLNILITDIEYLELIGNCFSFCHVGITGITLQQKKLLAQYYSNKVLIVDQQLSNTYIDIIITNKKQILTNLIHKNYIKYIYAINSKFALQYYKAYQATLPNSYFYINRLSIQAYKQIQFKQQKKDKQIIIQSNNKFQQISKKQLINYNANKNTVSIIVSYHNNQTSTIKLIKSLQKYSLNGEYVIKLILISDGSLTNIIESISKQLAKCKNITYQCIFNQKRCGYIKSTNIGIKRALQLQSQYIVLMHNDIQVSYNWKDLIKNISNNVIATCPITNSQYDQHQSIKYIRNNNKLQNFPKSFQKCKTLTINQMLNIYKNKNIKLSKNTFIPNFFCIAFRASVFCQLGLLDQSYGQGFGQNIDFIQKIYNNNYEIEFIPSVYVPHIGRNTFKDLYPLKQLNKNILVREVFNNFAIKLNTHKEKKKVIYTCVTNNYDEVKHSIYNTSQCDYILFGQNIQNIDGPWKYINIQPFKQLIGTNDPVKIARFFKTHPHILFKNYQESMWIDGNIDIITDPSNIFDLFIDGEFLMIPKHPNHSSVYSEAQVCKAMKKDTQQNIDKIINFLNQNNFKDSTPLVQSGIILRRHNNIKCKKLMNNWWNLILQFSKRDQLSFNYCLEKSNEQVLLIDWNIFNNKYIKWNGKHGK